MLPQSEIIFNNYFSILYIGLLIVTLFFYIEDNYKENPHNKLKLFFLVFFSILFLLLFGLRDLDVGIDTEIYLYLFTSRYAQHKDVGFRILTDFLKKITDEHGYLFSIAAIYMTFFLMFIKNWSYKYSIYLLFLFASLFIFKNMGMNVIRQGLACVFFLYALSLQRLNKKKISIIFFVIAFSMQATIIIPILIWYTSKVIKLKMSIFFVLFCSFLSIIGYGLDKLAGFLPFFSNLFENRFDTYLDGTAGKDYIIGFRVNFFLFNWFFIVVFLYAYKKNILLFSKDIEIRILKSFIILSGIFFLYFNLPYSDRIGLLSWIFIPLLFIMFFDGEKFVSQKYKMMSIFLFLIIFMIFVLFPSK